MPPEDGFGLHQQQGITPAVHDPRQQDQQTALVRLEDRTLDLPGCHDELLTRQSVLGNELRASPGQVAQDAGNQGPGPGRLAHQRPGAGRQARQPGTKTEPKGREHAGVLLNVGRPIKS
jgi:hypothetical protein